MSSTNDQTAQMADAMQSLQRAVGDSSDAFTAAAAYQLTVHAIALALQNAVAQQQQEYALRNAVTAAAARAVLDGKPQEAEAALALADKSFGQSNIARTLDELQTLMARVSEMFNRARGTLDSARE